jgi:hypothetical protein
MLTYIVASSLESSTCERNQIATLENLLNTREFSSVRLPTQDVTYAQRCFKQSIADLCFGYHSSPTLIVFVFVFVSVSLFLWGQWTRPSVLQKYLTKIWVDTRFNVLHWKSVDVSLYIHIYIWLYSPLLDLGRLFSFLSYYRVGRTPWTGDQTVARPPPTHRTAHTRNKLTQTSMSLVGFELNIPVLEQAKTIYALDRAATLISM